MTDLAIIPAAKISSRVAGLFKTPDADFETRAVTELPLTFAGIPGDRHEGTTRRSGGREPWYPRGTEIRNERQLSILAADELAAFAAIMGIERIAPEWIGGNIVLDGIANLSMVPPRTLLFFAGGVTLKVDGQNAPCRTAGGAIAGRYPERVGLDLAFAKGARRLRGLVAWVEKPGTIRDGEAVEARLPEQWIYR